MCLILVEAVGQFRSFGAFLECNSDFHGGTQLKNSSKNPHLHHLTGSLPLTATGAVCCLQLSSHTAQRQPHIFNFPKPRNGSQSRPTPLSLKSHEETRCAALRIVIAFCVQALHRRPAAMGGGCARGAVLPVMMRGGLVDS